MKGGTLLTAGVVLSRAGAVPLINAGTQLQQKFGPLISAHLVESIYSQTCTDSDFTTLGIPESLLDNIKLFGNFTAASYCPRNEKSTSETLITCPLGVCPLVEADNGTSLVEFGGSNDTTVADIKGFVALDQKRSLVVIAFAGSGNTIHKLAHRLHIHSSAIQPPRICIILGSLGFELGWSERRTAVLDAVTSALAPHPNYSLIITGHSIGAGVATLAGVELRNMKYSADIYTFGSPRVGNEPFATFVAAQSPQLGRNYRITDENDPVPQLPPTWTRYQHTSPDYRLTNGTDTTDMFAADEIVVCEGIGNEEGNTGTGLVPIDSTAHDHYLGNVCACQGPVAF